MGKGDHTRSTILDRALSMATQVGLEGVSIGALAKDVEMSKSGLYAHFDSKENLQLQVMSTAAERFIELVVRPALAKPRGEARVRALFEGWITWTRAPYLPGGCLFINTALEYSARPGIVRDHLVSYQRDWLDTLANAARIAMTEGQFRSDIDPDQFAYDLESICLAYQYFSNLMHDPQTEERARTAFESLIQRSRA